MPRPSGTFMHVDSLKLDLNVKKVRMSVSKVFNNNRILSKLHLNRKTVSYVYHIIIINYLFLAEATNLFLRENGLEVLKAMQPQLTKKLEIEFSNIANQLLEHVPIEYFLID